MAKKRFFKSPKNGRFGRPWAGRTGRMGQMGAARLRFGSRRTSGASFVKIGLGPPTPPIVDYEALRCKHS